MPTRLNALAALVALALVALAEWVGLVGRDVESALSDLVVVLVVDVLHQFVVDIRGHSNGSLSEVDSRVEQQPSSFVGLVESDWVDDFLHVGGDKGVLQVGVRIAALDAVFESLHVLLEVKFMKWKLRKDFYETFQNSLKMSKFREISI